MQCDDDFYEGFRQGVRAIFGTDALLPAVADIPTRVPNRTMFQVGLVRGIEHAKGWREGCLLPAAELADCASKGPRASPGRHDAKVRAKA